MFATAWHLARKDLLLFGRDRTALLLTFLLPIVLGTVFGTAMSGMSGGGGGGPAARVELAVEDRDGSAASAELLAALRAASGLEVELVPDARRPVASGAKPCGLVIPAGYGAGVAAGNPPELRLLRDPSRTISQQVVLFQLAPVLLPRQAQIFGAGVMERALELVDFPPAGRPQAAAALRESYERIEGVLAGLGRASATEGRSEVAQDDGGAPGPLAAPAGGFDPLRELPRFLGLSSEDVIGGAGAGLARSAGPSHAFSAMAVMMLLFSVVGAGGTLLQERAEGTLTRLQLTPAAGGAVLLGKLLAISLIALAQLVLLFSYGGLVFAVPVLAAPMHLALVSLAWVYLAIGIGIFFAVACRTQKQLEGLSTLVILVMSAVGGAWFPREITPDWFRAVGSITPVAWAMDAYHGVLWYGKGVLPTDERSGIWLQLTLMLAVGTLLLALAARFYRRRYGARG